MRVIGVHQGAFIIDSYVKKGYEVERHAISARTPTKILWTFKTPKDSLTVDNINFYSPEWGGIYPGFSQS